MNHVSDVATDPAATPGPNNSARLYDRQGRPLRQTYTAIRDGVQIKVVYEPATDQIISAYPTGLVDSTTGELLPYPTNPN